MKPDGERFDRLINNVVMEQNRTTIYCDLSILLQKTEFCRSLWKGSITEGDSVTITARKLEYDGETRIAKLRENVVFVKLATATLYTDHLDYQRDDNMAFYYNGGKLVDSVNVLTSRKGYYDVTSNMASFKRNVKVTNPDYTMTADSLQYNSRSKIIYFRTPTTIVNKDSSTALYESGFYETIGKQSVLESTIAETQDYKLDAIESKIDQLNQRYTFRKNVVMTHKKENLIIYGQAVDYYKSTGVSKVYNNAYLAKVTDGGDTLFISADTLVSIDNKIEAKKRLLAYNNVKIFRRDMQGLADSLEYRLSDSTLFFYEDPVLWSEGNQMTADSIRMLMKNNTIDRIFMIANAFVISRDTLINFNQIKGER